MTCWTFALSGRFPLELEAICSLKLAEAAPTVSVPVPVSGNLTGAGTAVLWAHP